MTSSSSDDRDPVERLAEEFLDRQRRGERPTVSEYAKLYPLWAERIEKAFSALQLMEQLKPRSGEHTDDFDHAGNAVCSPLGEHLGDYRILREIGRGGMGIVYEAIQESLGRRVALKVLPMHGRINPVQMERFRLEARSAARLHHTNIVPVHGVGEHDGVPYYAMQYIPGHGLDEVLEDVRRLRAGGIQQPRHAAGEAISKPENGSLAVARSLLTGRFDVTRAEASQGDVSVPSRDGDPTACGQPEPISSPDKHGPATPSASGAGDGSVLSLSTVSGYHRAVAQVGLQVARALSHAHELGVLHRDIKPSNLLLDAGGHVWVTDFGLAKLEGSEGPTQAGDVVGTLRYMAPERFDGWSDRRSDVYGLGMTLYELLTLHPAFEAATRAKLIDQVIHEPAPPPHRHDPKVPRDLETIVLKAISKEPGDRYATADALAADIENFLADKPILARRSGLPERAWRWCRRNPVAAALASVSSVTVLALLGLGVALFIQSQLRSAFTEADRQRRIAESQRGIAVDALAREQTFSYENRVLFAQRELDDNDVGRAEQLLDECPANRRAWEWQYLKRQCHTELRSLSGHAGSVWAVAISPDGKWIASGGNDRIIRLWEAATGRLVRELPGHGEPIGSLAFNPDGTKLASVGGSLSHSDRLLVHTVETGKLIVNLPLDTGELCGLGYCPDGRSLAIASGERKQGGWVCVLNADSGGERRDFPLPEKKPAYRVSFSPDGKRLLSAVGRAKYGDPDLDRNQLIVWDVASRTVCKLLPAAGDVFAVFSPDGRKIASSGTNTTVRLWDAVEGKLLRTCHGHRGGMNSVAFSRDSGRLASASDDCTAKIWNVETGEELLQLRGHLNQVSCVTFSPDGQQLVTSSNDSEVKVFDAKNSRDAVTLAVGQGTGNGIAFSPDSRHLVSCGMDHKLKLWNLGSGKLQATWTDHSMPVWRAAFSPDSQLIASVAGDWTGDDEPGEIIVRDASTGGVKHRLKAHRGIARSVAFSPDGRFLATGGKRRTPDQELILWDVKTGKRAHVWSGLPGGVNDIAFTPDGRQLFAMAGTTIQAREIETWRTSVSFVADRDLVDCFALSPDGRLIASGGTEIMRLRVWDASSGSLVRTLGSIAFYSPSFSPDGRRIAAGGSQASIRIFDVDSGQNMLTLRGKAAASAVAFSPDGRFIASIHDDGEIKLWNGSPEEGDR